MKKFKNLLICAVLAACCLLAVSPFAFAADKDAKPASSGSDKLGQLFDSISQVRVFIEFYFMESGDYPDNLDQLLKDLNSILPNGYKNVTIPKDPATGKDFVYSRAKDGKTYTLAAPDASAYGLNKVEISSVNWAGFNAIAEERKYRFLGMICVENIKGLATALEYYAKDNKGKFPSELKKMIPSYIKSMPVCPITGKDYEFKVEGDDYIIRCPNPREHKMEEIMFSSKRGWITK
ncbi:MAG: hypothetical protein LWY06_06925 [Firmicutes bacterium]|nr:hypothetical protein [Bacillota bacterium]